MGTAYIYPETDSTIIFFLDLNKGGPSYNMGQKLGQCIMHGDTGDYFFKDKKDTLGCKLQFVFSKHHLTINTVGDYYECGYGFGVLSDGVFKRRSGKVPAHPPEEMFAAPEDYK